MAADNLSEEDKEFLAKMEEELKDRYTDKDVEFMKVFNMELSVPPIIENWAPNNSGRRNNRYNPYNRHGSRDNRDNRDNRDGRNSGDRRDGHRRYNDYKRGYSDYDDNVHDNPYKRRRY